MGISRFLSLKQLISNSTLKSLKSFSTKPQQIKLSTQFATPKPNKFTGYYDKSSLHYKVVQFLATSPKSKVTPFLDQHIDEGNAVAPPEVKKLIQTLRRKNLFDHALEVSQWMTDKSPPNFSDLAVQLDLIGQVHGIDAAERFFNNLDDQSEKLYGALLSCYVKRERVDKSLSLFKKMEDMGFANCPLVYNNIMSLYMKTGQAEKVPEKLSEMVDNGVAPDHVSYKICLQSFALMSDFTNMEQVVKKIESLPRFSVNWSIYGTVANYFIEAGNKEKAIYYLQKAVNIVRSDAVGYNYLITMYAKLGDVTEVLSLWSKRKSLCRRPINVDYATMIGSLVKLDKFQEAERLLQEWESSGNLYDFRVPNVVLLGYTKKGLVEEAQRVLDGIISKGKPPGPNTWSIISAGHIKCQNMEEALKYMKKALEQGPEHQGWVPNAEVTSSIHKWLCDSGRTEELHEFLKLLKMVVSVDHELYQNLLTGNVRHGNEVDDSLDNMKVDSLDVDKMQVA